MISTLIAFLGGATFRMIWGEVSAWINKNLDHSQEIERIRLEADLDAKRHARQQEAIKTQADLKIEVIRVGGEQATAQTEAEAWGDGVRATSSVTGTKWVDAWNASIRPLCATWSILMLTFEAVGLAQFTETSSQVYAAALGLFLADRTLFKRGK